MSKNKKKLVLISDTHGQHEQVKIPKCDFLICSGDVTTEREGFTQLATFFDWMKRQPATHCVFCFGNHDGVGADDMTACKKLAEDFGVTLLAESLAIIDGVSLWGSAYTVDFCSWFFMKPASQMHEIWSLCPEKVDVLVTHGPARGILDLTYGGVHAGCVALRNTIDRLQPVLHVFGHIHEQRGVANRYGTVCVNASINEVLARKIHKPVVAYLTRVKKAWKVTKVSVDN